ncbi:predicted protein [Histoplasma mississippiense (nom. inval.)]|uniref:predicted protein n=1 Tax=Ajellomyces capsulatus (strain NAm1 / WU24) TaxID=2059318 RepID=UPI000157B39C|nr:predicted protein [Histoplasma mississippiense (nom. inval.)]EDN02506.1 predicted protein [Histoplasma mississippiense (nom. inval.)]
MTGQEQSEETEEKMDPEAPTIYDIWKAADGLFKGESVAKRITFMSSRDGFAGFVRVIGGDEGYAGQNPRTFDIPAWHSCEVLGCKIKFTRA